MDNEKAGLSVFVATATLLLFSCSSTDLDVQEPSNIQKILLDAVKRGNVVKVSLGLCVPPNSILVSPVRPDQIDLNPEL